MGLYTVLFPTTVSSDPPTSLRFLWWTLGRSLWWLLKPSLLVLNMSTDVCMFLGAKGEGGRDGGRERGRERERERERGREGGRWEEGKWKRGDGRE